MDYKDLEAGASKDSFWFKAKRDLIYVLMKRACKDNRQLKILNIGAGIGDDLDVLNKFGKLYIVDLDKKALSIIDDKLCEDKKFGDACYLPYDDDFFDVVVSFDVFEHIKFDKRAMKEAHRVLKNGRALVFTVPAHQALFSSHDIALEHYRRYSKKEIKDKLGKFKDLNISYWNSLLFLPMAAVRLATKNTNPKVSHMNLSSWMNTFLYRILLVENFMIKYNIPIPIGLSIVGFCYKRK